MNRRLSFALGNIGALVVALTLSASALAAVKAPSRKSPQQSICLTAKRRSEHAVACRSKLASQADVIAHVTKVISVAGDQATSKATARKATTTTGKGAGKGKKGSGSTGGSGSSTGAGGSSTGAGGSSTGSSGSSTGSSGSSAGSSGTSGSSSNPAASLTGRLIVGLNANTAGWGGASTGPRLDQVMSQTNATWLREEFQWGTIEPSPGVFDFSYYDNYMLQAAQRGVHILAVLDDTPAWAGANWDTLPSDPTAYAQFVAAVVGRYGAGGSFWTEYPSLAGSAITTFEFWNEAYYVQDQGATYDPTAYANMAKDAAIAGRAVDPSAKFLIDAEMTGAADASGNWVWWVDALYQAVPDLNDYFDGVSVHPYGTDLTDLSLPVTGQAYTGIDQVQRVEAIRQQFISHGATDKPFWITEIGWSTCTGDSDCVSDSQQASNLSTVFGWVNGSWSDFVQGIFVYSYTDGSDATGIQDGYGLTTDTYSAKPVLAVFEQEESGAGS